MKTLMTSALLLITGSLFAQNPLPKGKAQLNAGIGLSGWGVPVYIGVDAGLSKDFTIGAEVSFRSWRENWKSNYYHHNITGFSGNLNYHLSNALDMPAEWDFYFGANAGFYVWSSPVNYPGTYSSGLGFGGQIGGRYYLSKKVGLNLEGGTGNAFSGGKFGLTIRL